MAKKPLPNYKRMQEEELIALLNAQEYPKCGAGLMQCLLGEIMAADAHPRKDKVNVYGSSEIITEIAMIAHAFDKISKKQKLDKVDKHALGRCKLIFSAMMHVEQERIRSEQRDVQATGQALGEDPQDQLIEKVRGDASENYYRSQKQYEALEASLAMLEALCSKRGIQQAGSRRR